MRAQILILVLSVIGPSNALAWWSTIVDTVEVRYTNGQLKEQYRLITFGGNEEARKSGFYRSWYENGQLEQEGQYGGDLKNGTWIEWDGAGRRIKEVSYIGGKKHGREIEWNTNQTIKKSLQYRNGNLHGKCTWRKDEYNINDFFNNACLTVVVERFYVEGALLVTLVAETDKPCVEGLSCGSPVPYYNSEYDLWIEWNNGCREFYVGQKINGEKDGKWTLWTANGDKKQVDFYENGKLLE
jgi:hypothetical protein